MDKKLYEEEEKRRRLKEAESPQPSPGIPGEKPVYKSGYEQQMNDVYEQIKSRKPFEFRLNGNALFDDIQDRARLNGKLAMRDTMGRAAALTGGYGSSYGQKVGQQAYDASLRESMDVIPELYNMALRRYEGEGQGLREQYGMLGDMARQEYGQYRDKMRDWEYGQEMQRQQEQLSYQRQQAAFDKLYSMIANYGYEPSPEELLNAGMTKQQADMFRQPYVDAHTPAPAPAGGYGGYGGGGGYSHSKGKGSSMEGKRPAKEGKPVNRPYYTTADLQKDLAQISSIEDKAAYLSAVMQEGKVGNKKINFSKY